MKRSIRYSKIERVTVELSRTDLLEAIIDYIRKSPAYPTGDFATCDVTFYDSDGEINWPEKVEAVWKNEQVQSSEPVDAAARTPQR